jgi:hypothetical protein
MTVVVPTQTRTTADVAQTIGRSEDQARLILQDFADRGYAVETAPNEWQPTTLALSAFAAGLSRYEVEDA